MKTNNMSHGKYRCKGSMNTGTACANQDLPEGVKECQRCTEAGFTPKKKAEAIAAEKERTKDFPPDRVKRGNEVRITSQPKGQVDKI